MRTRFRDYAWSVLAFHLAVILWGAFVRASGSGAECGEHWPLCNGQIVPRTPLNPTLIKFSRRFTSARALLSVLVLVSWTLRRQLPQTTRQLVFTVKRYYLPEWSEPCDERW